jgi:hypothetical protein
MANRLQTSSPALYPQSTLAVASIYLSTRLSSPPVALPLSPVPWWTLFDTTEEEIIDVCGTLLQLYRDWGGGEVTATSEQETGRGGLPLSVWRRAAGLPIEKSGVRQRIEGANGHSNGREDGE